MTGSITFQNRHLSQQSFEISIMLRSDGLDELSERVHDGLKGINLVGHKGGCLPVERAKHKFFSLSSGTIRV